MTMKTGLGIVGGALVLFALYLIYADSRVVQTPEPATSTATSTNIIGAPAALGTTTPAATAKAIASGAKPAIQIKEVNFAFFDHLNMKDTSGSPVISGIANVATVDVIVAQGDVGIEAGRNIPVVNGRWSYNGAKILDPGTYRVQLIGGTKVQETSLTVTN